MNRPDQILTALLCLLLCACQSRDNAPFEWLNGSWESEGSQVFESWVSTGDSLIGYGVELKSGKRDTTERINLRKDSAGFVYTVVVRDQNNGLPIEFRVQPIDERAFEATNPEHDFPQRLKYRLREDGKLEIEVGDMRETRFKLILNRNE